MPSTFYVRQSGSDSNNGTSAATAFRTIGKLLGATGMSSGDTAYIGAGTYREVVTVAMTSAVAETKIIGDVTGTYTGDAGEVIWSAYTAGDRNNLANPATCNLNNRNFLTFANITFIGQLQCILCTGSTNITIQDCTFFSARTFNQTPAIAGTVSFGQNAAWLIQRCRFFSQEPVSVTLTTSATGADYDANILVENCVMLQLGAFGAVTVRNSGTNTYRGGGVIVRNCTSIGVNAMHVFNYISTVYPCKISNCLCYFTNAFVNTTIVGSLIDDGGNNAISLAGAAYTNVTPHATSRNNTFQFNNPYPFELGQTAVLGLPYRAPFQPYAASGTYPAGALGFGNVAGGTTTSITGRARPSGSGIVWWTGTATGATTSTLSDSGKTFPTSSLIGKLVRITGGTGSGQVKRISANTATQVTISGAPPAGGLWATTPSTDSTYIIYDGPQVETGKATAGAATTLTDGGANWATNQWAGYSLELTGGTGSGQTATITSNTATAITVPTWATNPDNTTTYSLYWPGGSLTATQASAGAFELGNTAKRVDGETGKGIQIDGPGSDEVQVPVTAAATTITVRALYDSNHGTTNKPQIQILAQDELGVSLTTATATGSADTYETLTVSFTPTAAGAVTLRFVSRSATPYGYARFDTVTVSP